jgi:lipopolysaccharide cholinephosphotransferase
MTLSITDIQSLETEILLEVNEICEKHNINYYLGYGSVLGGVRHNAPIPWDSDADILIPDNEFENFISIIKSNLSAKFFVDYYDCKYYPFLFPRIGVRGYSTYILHVDIFRLVGTYPILRKQKKYRKTSMFYQNIFLLKRASRKYFFNHLSQKQRILYFFTRLLLSLIPDKYVIKKFNNHCSKLAYESAFHIDNPNGCHGIMEVIPKSFIGKGAFIEYSNYKLRIPEKFENYLQHFYGDYLMIPPEKERKINQFYDIDTYN